MTELDMNDGRVSDRELTVSLSLEAATVPAEALIKALSHRKYERWVGEILGARLGLKTQDCIRLIPWFGGEVEDRGDSIVATLPPAGDGNAVLQMSRALARLMVVKGGSKAQARGVVGAGREFDSFIDALARTAADVGVQVVPPTGPAPYAVRTKFATWHDPVLKFWRLGTPDWWLATGERETKFFSPDALRRFRDRLGAILPLTAKDHQNAADYASAASRRAEVGSHASKPAQAVRAAHVPAGDSVAMNRQPASRPSGGPPASLASSPSPASPAAVRAPAAQTPETDGRPAVRRSPLDLLISMGKGGDGGGGPGGP